MGEDAIEIVAYYLKSKRFVEGVDPTVIAKIMIGHSLRRLGDRPQRGRIVRRVPAGGAHHHGARFESLPAHGVRQEKRGRRAGRFLQPSLRPSPYCLPFHLPRGGPRPLSPRCSAQAASPWFSPAAFGRKRADLRATIGNLAVLSSNGEKNALLLLLEGWRLWSRNSGIPDVGCGEDLDFAFYKVWGLISRTCINGFSLLRPGTERF